MTDIDIERRLATLEAYSEQTLELLRAHSESHRSIDLASARNSTDIAVLASMQKLVIRIGGPIIVGLVVAAIANLLGGK